MTLTIAALFLLGAPLAASESDDRIVATFERSYVFKTYLVGDTVRASVKDGVVTLVGTVEDDAHRKLAQDTAAGLPGVVRVDNQLTITGVAVAERSDLWIGNRVRMTLLFHRNVSAGRTTVAVKDGVVTLTGEADSMAQRELTVEYAKDIDGVREVKDAMTVQASAAPAIRPISEQLDDASISAQVKAALSTHRSTSAVKTGVETRKGEVTLTGIAKNDAERSLVSKLVGDIQGVTRVENRMTVAAVGGK